MATETQQINRFANYISNAKLVMEMRSQGTRKYELAALNLLGDLSREAVGPPEQTGVNQELLEACKMFMGHLESGLLVRDISKDAAPDWAMKVMRFVTDLNQAQAAIARAEGAPDPAWCYVCDRPANDCACELDPNGPLPQSACMRTKEITK